MYKQGAALVKSKITTFVVQLAAIDGVDVFILHTITETNINKDRRQAGKSLNDASR